ncbi:P-loop containing nucleoside triphosphate hydrolase protein [Thozetella sp. PMI_491]|nr:P-loop containing nucleoside triphosphate hydrolase protein [Thozetella sp. PMI_491]
MSLSSNSSCTLLDNSFGPYAGECRGGFDFTLLFEETILTILPLGFFLLLLPPRLWFLFKRTKKLVSGSNNLLVIKTSAWISLWALQLAELILWAAASATRTRVSIAARTVSLLSTVFLCLLSYAEHGRTIRPSTLLSTCLFITLLLDIACVRTLWLRATSDPDHVIAQISIASVAVKAVVLVVEALEKRRVLRPEYRNSSPEATGSIYNRYFFWWLNSLFRLGFRRVLDVDDLFVLDKHLQATYLHRRFESAWATIVVGKKSPYSLFKTSFGVLKWPLLRTIPPRACLTALNFCQPFLINRAILLSQEAINDKTTQIGYGLIGAYLLVYVGIAVSTGQYQHRTYRSITMARAGLVSIIYQKTGTLSLKDLDPASSMTLMSADVERIVQGWQTMHEIWANAVEVAIAIFLLQRQLGVACVVPVAVSIVSLLGSLVAMGSIMSRQAAWLEAIEKRISATSAMLSSMKGVKMCGLKDTLLASVQKLRVEELHISKRFRKLIIWNMTFAYVTQIFAPVLSFAIFSVLARNGGNDRTLDTARVFTSLSLFALLSEPLASLVMSLASFMGALGSFVRIQQFLDSEERSDTRCKLPEFDETNKSAASDAITVSSADFGWSSSKQSPLLRGIQFSVPFRQLTMVVGPVGCGKSTLLNAILGEIPAQSGSVQLRSMSIAYCSQVPWHMNGTIREAITGSEPFDEKWYTRVVSACALRQDLEELPIGDSSRIGSGGVALSGGQSKRIALARAVYARREIAILDDVFSGLDTSTENHIFHSLLGRDGLFREMQTTIVLVTSSAKRLPYSDNIVCLGPTGEITEHGTFADLKDLSGYVSSFNLPCPDRTAAVDGSDGMGLLDVDRDGIISADTKDIGYGPSISSGESPSGKPLEQSDTSRQTSDMQIYLYYVRSVGWWASLIFVFAIIGFVFCTSFPNIWVEWWAADNEAHPNDRLGYWLGVYAALGGLAIICLFVSCWQMIITMVPRSGENFHLVLLKTVLSAPMSFFVETDSGVTLNRFSQDLQLIDMELPVAALNAFATLVLCVAQMVLIGVGSIYAAISFPIILVALFIIQKFYLRTSRQLRLLDLETKAPLYSLFEESLGGLATIRSFGWQNALRGKNHTLLDRSQRPFYLLFAVQRWLTLVLDLIVAAAAVVLIVLVVALRGTVGAGGVGLALLNVIQFSQTIKLLVTFWTTLETHIGSVARIKSFTETTVSEDQTMEKEMPPPDWPSTGAIEFENLSAAYSGSDLVLRDVSLSIKAGEKIGICGRTGSGKTSLITTIFRILDLQAGSIRVDGVDIASLPRQEVRRRIVGVPQHPFLLKGSVRLNADPTGAASDESIKTALRSVQLSQLIEDSGGLDTDVDALNLSSGQQQLFCLARAILRPSTVLVLDEVTSSIDAHTEEIIQRLIRKKFANHTIIAVAHRLETIMDFDKVAVLDAGRLVEFDSPYALLDVPGSAFAALYSASLAEEEHGEEEGKNNEAPKEANI